MEPSWKNEKIIEIVKNRININLIQFENLVLSLSQVCPKLKEPELMALIVVIASKPIDIKTLMEILNQTNRTRFKKRFIDPLINEELINYTIPDKPNSPKQKYVITKKGSDLLNAMEMKK